MNFQRSYDSNRQRVRFTINVGVKSDRIWRVLDPERHATLNALPQESEWDWRERIGLLFAERWDRWWEISRGDPVADLSDEIVWAIQTLALPVIEQFSTDESLRDALLAGEQRGLFERDRDARLLVLLRDLGPEDVYRRRLRRYWIRSTARRRPYARDLITKLNS
jgi:hypothetical protein